MPHHESRIAALTRARDTAKQLIESGDRARAATSFTAACRAEKLYKDDQLHFVEQMVMYTLIIRDQQSLQEDLEFFDGFI
jgi:hypothetical protein